MTFYDYVMQREITNDPAGDFVGDCRHPSMPPFRSVTEWAQMKQALQDIGASDAVIAAGLTVWRAYKSSAASKG